MSFIKRGYNKNTNQTQFVFEDGSKETYDGKLESPPSKKQEDIAPKNELIPEKFTKENIEALRLPPLVSDVGTLLSDTGHGVAQGATFGFSDELEGKLRSLAGKDDYDTAIQKVRERYDVASGRSPVSYSAGQLLGSLTVPNAAGALTRGALGGILAKQSQWLANSPKAMGAITGAAEGAATGELYNYGQSASDEEYNATKGEGAKVGGVLGLLGGFLGAAITKDNPYATNMKETYERGIKYGQAKTPLEEQQNAFSGAKSIKQSDNSNREMAESANKLFLKERQNALSYDKNALLDPNNVTTKHLADLDALENNLEYNMGSKFDAAGSLPKDHPYLSIQDVFSRIRNQQPVTAEELKRVKKALFDLRFKNNSELPINSKVVQELESTIPSSAKYNKEFSELMSPINKILAPNEKLTPFEVEQKFTKFLQDMTTDATSGLRSASEDYGKLLNIKDELANTLGLDIVNKRVIDPTKAATYGLNNPQKINDFFKRLDEFKSTVNFESAKSQNRPFQQGGDIRKQFLGVSLPGMGYKGAHALGQARSEE